MLSACEGLQVVCCYADMQHAPKIPFDRGHGHTGSTLTSSICKRPLHMTHSCQIAPLPGRLQDGELRGGVRRGEAVHQPRHLPLLVSKVLQDGAQCLELRDFKLRGRSTGDRRSGGAQLWHGAAVWRCAALALCMPRGQYMLQNRHCSGAWRQSWFDGQVSPLQAV
jgi:hypothetical protein